MTNSTLQAILILISILNFTITTRAIVNDVQGFSDKELIPTAYEDSKEARAGITDGKSFKHLAARQITDHETLRTKRSLFNDDTEDLVKRLSTDFGFGSRLQAAEKVARGLSSLQLFGMSGPGKRSPEMTDFDTLKDVFRQGTIDKRRSTDFDYYSRIQLLKTSENMAKYRYRNGVFGITGSGKRSAVYRSVVPKSGLKFSENIKINSITLPKRIVSVSRYGSREQAAENLAKTSGSLNLFDIHEPGKRSKYEEFDFKLYDDKTTNSSELRKRIVSDFGYGSRVQAAENLAKTSGSLNLFGIHGPGKRSKYDEFDFKLYDDKTTNSNELQKRIVSEFGYGSRSQAAKKLAKSTRSLNLFGIQGPGKRSERSENDFNISEDNTIHLIDLMKRIVSDFGYGSREQAAENLAKISKLSGSFNPFGINGPGKRSEYDKTTLNSMKVIK